MPLKKFPLISALMMAAGLLLLLTGCVNGESPPPTLATATGSVGETPTIPSQPTFTPAPLSTEQVSTQEPLVARVNGEGIPLALFQSEIARYQGLPGTGLATYTEEKILEDLIDQVLLAQAAEESGFEVNDTLLDSRIQALGLSEQALTAWMADYGYSQDEFRLMMKWAVAAAWMRDRIIAEIPETAEQVRARQILLYNSSEANNVFVQLQSGTEFGTLAAQYEPLAAGDLGWFPRGYLNVTELDEVVFNLEPGNYSDIIQTPLGYHIVQVLEKDTNHPLSADARRVLQVQALSDWLDARVSESEIIILQP
jgi:peptidyl-prolyl cis-trans isomerase C